jgi:hypothetical protein
MKRIFLILVLVGLFFLLAWMGWVSCSAFRAATPTPTFDVTMAYRTVQAKLTQIQSTTEPAITTPAPTSDQPRTSTPTQGTPRDSTPTPTKNFITPTGTLVCDRAAAGDPIDVTIPDDTEMRPGETFTKIWRLDNMGTCTWTPDYAASFFYGEQMGAPDLVRLGESVLPGEAVEIAVEMTAPEAQGSYQGNWKLRNAAGGFFGIGPNGDAPFWVRILVIEAPADTPTPSELPTLTLTPTSTPSPTETSTPTPTPGAQGIAVLAPGDMLDLDTVQVNTGEEDDLFYQVDTNGYHWLSPRPGVMLGIYGVQQPSLQVCQSGYMGTAPVAIESLSLNTYLCHRTNQGRVGWTLLKSFNTQNASVELEVITWSLP